MLFVGVHVAPVATIIILEGDEFASHVKELMQVPKKDIVKTIVKHVGDGSVFVAIDTPLIMKGKRHVEALLDLLFSQYHVKRKLPKTANDGEQLVSSLKKEHIIHEPHIAMFERSRKCFEVSPAHASIVFGRLSQAIHHDTIDIKAYQELVKLFDKLHLPKGMLTVNHNNLSKDELRKYESELDAVVAAYTAYFSWHNPKKCEILGNMREGYVLSPVFSREEKQVEDYLKKA